MATTAIRLPRAERRAQLLRSAAGVFLGAGFEATSMEDVARSAGVTRLIVYRIFDSKDDLYRAVLDDVTGRLVQEFSGRSRTELVSRGGIARVVLDVARAEPDGFRLLWRHAAVEPAFAEYAATFRRLVTDYADALIHPLMEDALMRRWAARAVVTHLYDGICAWLDEGDPERDGELAELLTRGIRALVLAWSA